MGSLLLCFHMMEGARELPRVSFLRSLISFMRALPSGPNHLPKGPSPNAITLGIRYQHITFRGTLICRL